MDRLTVVMDRVEASYNRVQIRVSVHDPTLRGQEVTLTVRRRVKVHDHRPRHGTATLATKRLTLDPLGHSFTLNLGKGLAYSYDGEHISVAYDTVVDLGDGWLWNTTLTHEHILDASNMQANVPTDLAIAKPVDDYDVATSFQALPDTLRARTYREGAAVGAVTVVLCTAVVSSLFRHAPWFSHVVDSVMAVGCLSLLAVGIGWSLLKGALAKHADLQVVWPQRVDMDSRMPLSQMLRGTSSANLDGARVRVVAYNLERGVYTRGSGKNRRSVSFSKPSRTTIVHETRIERLPAGTPLESVLTDEVDFARLFLAVLPPQFVSASHGLDVHWEIQVLHDAYIDHRFPGPKQALKFDALWG